MCPSKLWWRGTANKKNICKFAPFELFMPMCVTNGIRHETTKGADIWSSLHVASPSPWLLGRW